MYTFISYTIQIYMICIVYIHLRSQDVSRIFIVHSQNPETLNEFCKSACQCVKEPAYTNTESISCT